MKKYFLQIVALLSVLHVPSCTAAQKAYFQQQVNMNIKVSLDTLNNTLTGFEKMEYINRSPDTLSFIWIHVWPNAYKNDRTAFSDQLLENGDKNFYFSDAEERGYINRLNFKVNGQVAEMLDHPQHQDIIKVLLPGPLNPGATAFIETDFYVKIPSQFSRSGVFNNSYQITQWFPKPAVYDRKGWHPMPYVDQGEFYSEFGNYKVEISVPAALTIAATGIKINEQVEAGKKTATYEQENVHDFAWFASSQYQVKHDTLQLPSGTIDVFAYHYPSKRDWNKSIQFIKDAISSKSRWIGEYPYKIVSVVEKQGKNDGGMEYPTITLISDNDDFLINHEVGHNWFYGILASNERQHPWMDEGMNTFYDERYSMEKYNKHPHIFDFRSTFLAKRMPVDETQMAINILTKLKKDQPIETASEEFSLLNYNLIAYGKAGKWMKLLEERLGRNQFDQAMRHYFEEWKFKHPSPEDFKQSIEQSSGQNLDDIFALLTKKGPLQNFTPKKKIKFASFFSFRQTDKYHYISVVPLIGANRYDKFMAGALLHNFSLPTPNLQFSGAALYATGSRQFNSIGKVAYNFFDDRLFEKISLGANWSAFSMKQSVDTSGKKLFERFRKISPWLRFYFNEKPRSTSIQWLEIRSILISEKFFDNYTFITGSDSSAVYPTTFASVNRYINQLSFTHSNFRIIYPYSYQISLQQGKGFYRLNGNIDYFFNYAKGGGLQARIFAAKFGQWGKKDLNSYLYQPKLLANTGMDDYSYSQYFIGRSASSANATTPVANAGLAARQLMIPNSGGLKLRMDKYSFLQGQSSDWVAAANLRSSLPNKMLPVKLPIYLFFDIGTYAEAWQKNPSTARFLYTGGIQLSLFNNVVNIYAPLILSKDFRNTLKSDPEENKFSKKITFSIDIQHISLKKFVPLSPL